MLEHQILKMPAGIVSHSSSRVVCKLFFFIDDKQKHTLIMLLGCFIFEMYFMPICLQDERILVKAYQSFDG